MPFVPMPPPPQGTGAFPPPRPVTRVSHIPIPVPLRKRRRRWPWITLAVVLFIVCEPVRILLCVLGVFWLFAIGVMPHVAAFKVATGRHRD